jgi:hypothetical protein
LFFFCFVFFSGACPPRPDTFFFFVCLFFCFYFHQLWGLKGLCFFHFCSFHRPVVSNHSTISPSHHFETARLRPAAARAVASRKATEGDLQRVMLGTGGATALPPVGDRARARWVALLLATLRFFFSFVFLLLLLFGLGGGVPIGVCFCQ